jgi:hypothetical protein
MFKQGSFLNKYRPELQTVSSLEEAEKHMCTEMRAAASDSNYTGPSLRVKHSTQLCLSS